MKRLNKLSNEELAAYMEGFLSAEVLKKVRDDMDVDMFELLRVAISAGELMPASRPTPFAWPVNAREYKAVSEASLPLAGFTGREHDDDKDDPV